MVSFQTKNTNLGTVWRTSEWKMLKYIPAIWNILRPLSIFYGHLGIFYGLLGIFYGHVGIFYGHVGIFYGNLGIFVVIWYIFPRFGTLYQEKSGNPV
jgi:hypothetical protein